MGVLEDAIREHLDLKRKHGASDAELNQQQAEALGPARREGPETEVAEPGHGDGAEVVEPAPDASVEPAPEVTEPVEPPPVEPAAVGPAPVEPPPVEPPPVEAPVAPEEGDEDPDFGGEAPEQKPPPRDFDFD